MYNILGLSLAMLSNFAFQRVLWQIDKAELFDSWDLRAKLFDCIQEFKLEFMDLDQWHSRTISNLIQFLKLTHVQGLSRVISHRWCVGTASSSKSPWHQRFYGARRLPSHRMSSGCRRSRGWSDVTSCLLKWNPVIIHGWSSLLSSSDEMT